jgi:opacity protein-like surface antigen
MRRFVAFTVPLAAAAVLCAAAASAQTAGNLPDYAFYGGLGGGYNSVSYGTQNVYAVGTSNVYKNGSQVSSGSASGPAALFPGSQSGFAPAVQLGYFQHFEGTPWLWGTKFTFGYTGQTSTLDHVLLPQAGSFTYTESHETVPFTGNAVVGSYQTSVNDQLALIPYVGHEFPNGFVYFGAGPTLSNLRTKLNNLVGFADVNGNHTDVSGSPLSFSASSWVFGGALTVGAAYFLTPKLFLDGDYTANITATAKGNYDGVFYNPNGSSGQTTIGTMVGSSTGNAVTQGLTVTINMAF